jgi:hypothetical protein
MVISSPGSQNWSLWAPLTHLQTAAKINFMKFIKYEGDHGTQLPTTFNTLHWLPGIVRTWDELFWDVLQGPIWPDLTYVSRFIFCHIPPHFCSSLTDCLLILGFPILLLYRVFALIGPSSWLSPLVDPNLLMWVVYVTLSSDMFYFCWHSLTWVQ